VLRARKVRGGARPPRHDRTRARPHSNQVLSGRLGGCFTRGLAWEPLHPDSLTANVEVQDGDPNSLLNRYRLLIHLRGQNPALGAGELLPLAASTDAVAAYLRRAGDRAVLVVANLGASGAPLQVGENGRIEGYLPLPLLAPMESHVFELAEVDR